MGDDAGHHVRLPAPAAALGIAFVVVLVAVLSIGDRGHAVDAIVLLPQIVLWAAPPVSYLVAAVGYGVLARPLVRRAADEPALVVGVGIALLATISQVAGCLGLLGTRPIAIALLVPGWLALGVFLWKRRTVRIAVPRPGLLAWIALVPLAVLVAAAAAPPGWLWASEYGGFDALSYHLQLPQEWLRLSRIEPLEYSVYSYLPGSFEAAVLHLAGMTGALEAGRDPAAGGGFGLLAETGWRAMSAQYLHAWLTVLAAWLVGRAAAAMVRSCGPVVGESVGESDPSAAEHTQAWARRAGTVASVLTLATPWCIVVGSLAYNEMAVVGLGAAALVAAVDRGLPAWRRGLLAGLLVGGACGFKPTAMTFLTPGIAVSLLAMARPREWGGVLAAAALAGLAMLLPWMVRNWAAGGNPVFPYASSVFGTAHWTAEQVARYHDGHAFHGSVLDRLRLLVGPDLAAQPQAGVILSVERWRGLFNPQYGVLFPAAVGGLVGLLIAVGRARRAVGLAILVMLAMLVLGLVAWLFTTHLQARFLLPLVLPACVLVGMALGWGDAGRGAAMRRWIAAALVAWQGGLVVSLFARQRDHGPNAWTVAGPARFTGEFLLDPGTIAAAFVGRVLPAGSRVLLLGDAAPFYLDAALQNGTRPEIDWHTTWDDSPLGDAIRATGSEDPGAWVAELRGRGFTHLLMNLAELRRYHRAGWFDPDVTEARVSALVRWLGPELRSWEDTRQLIYVLPEGGGDGSG